MSNDGDEDQAIGGEPRAEEPGSSADAVALLSARWEKEHAKRAAEVEAELVKQRSKPSAEERLLLRLAAHDIALADALGRAETQLAERTLALVDNVKVALSLARTLKEVTACRTEASRRIEQLLQTAGVIRGQQRLAEVVPLRRTG